jgi:hypothetical protein
MKLIAPLTAFLVFMLSPVLCFSQLSGVTKEETGTIVGQVISSGRIISRLSYQVYKQSDTLCTLVLHDTNPESLTVSFILFWDRGGVIDSLYTLLKSVFSPENKQSEDFRISFTLGFDTLTVYSIGSGHKRRAEISTKNGVFLLTEKEVDKLFGKR